VCYYYGQGVTKNETTAAHYFLLAANRGHAKAQCNLGVCFKKGKGLDKDLDQALLWYQLSANQGDRDAKEALHAIRAQQRASSSSST
jgi:hypothetical protein